MKKVRMKTPAHLFLALNSPFGVAKGYVAITLAFYLAKVGLPTAIVAGIVSMTIWPQTIKVLWAPLIDTTLSAKSWLVIGTVVTSLTIVLISVISINEEAVPLLATLVAVSSFSSTLVSMSSELLMATAVEDDRKGSAAGYAQAGNVGGVGIGGGAGLYLSQHLVAHWLAGGVLMVVCLACCAALLLVDQPDHAPRAPRHRDNLIVVAKDIWGLVRSRRGLVMMVLMILPIGSGGALGVWSAVASEWSVGSNVMALVNGVLGGVAALLGAVSSGLLYDRWNRRTIYCCFGLVLAATAVLMAFLPRTPGCFIACTLVYAALIGACYAGYSAAVLETIGKSTAATKFNFLSSIANIPVALMTIVDGIVHDHFGSTGMLIGEGMIAFTSVGVFAAFVSFIKRGNSVVHS